MRSIALRYCACILVSSAVSPALEARTISLLSLVRLFDVLSDEDDSFSSSLMADAESACILILISAISLLPYSFHLLLSFPCIEGVLLRFEDSEDISDRAPLAHPASAVRESSEKTEA